jgi:hypothetical protein
MQIPWALRDHFRRKTPGAMRLIVTGWESEGPSDGPLYRGPASGPRPNGGAVIWRRADEEVDVTRAADG